MSSRKSKKKKRKTRPRPWKNTWLQRATLRLSRKKQESLKN